MQTSHNLWVQFNCILYLNAEILIFKQSFSHDVFMIAICYVQQRMLVLGFEFLIWDSLMGLIKREIFIVWFCYLVRVITDGV